MMQLVLGIDSGAIIATERTRINGSESLDELHWKIMEHGFGLYCRVINLIAKNDHNIKAIPQDQIAYGRTYYNREWDTWQILKT